MLLVLSSPSPHLLFHVFHIKGKGAHLKRTGQTPHGALGVGGQALHGGDGAGPAFSLWHETRTGRWIKTLGPEKALGAGGTENSYYSDGNLAYRTRTARHGSRVRPPVGLPWSR